VFQVPELWSTFLPNDVDESVLNQRIAMISRIEFKKHDDVIQKTANKLALQEAKKRSKEALEAERVRIAQEKINLAEAKKKKNFNKQLQSNLKRPDWQQKNGRKLHSSRYFVLLSSTSCSSYIAGIKETEGPVTNC
jgi:FKBP-type peptidyl-prolyl cis-trans isomerase